MADKGLKEFAEEVKKEDDPLVAELRSANRTLQRQLSRSRARTEELRDAVYKAAKDAALIAGDPPKVAKPKADKRVKAEVAILHCSDWQVGKETATYNSAVARERIQELTKRTIVLTEIQRTDHPVTDCHVLLGGDTVEGITVFPGQAYEVDSTLFEQVFNSVETIVEMVLGLLPHFEKVVVWEEPGNHGRIGRRGDVPAGDNLDRMVYHIAHQRLEGQDRVEWHPSTSWHQIVEIGNYRALLVHGDEIKGFGGQTPAYGIIRKVNAWATGVVEDFTDCYMGHFHTPMVLPLAHGRGRVFINPSTESDSVYAQEFCAATGTPGQRLNFVDPHKGRVTAEYVIWLD